jgi:DNA-binding transcriptional ArsR family regulator
MVLSNENLGLPLAETDIEPLPKTAVVVLREVSRLSATNPKGESESELSATNPKYIYLEFVAVSSTSLVASLKMSERTIRRILNNLLRRGLVEKVGERGGWRLTAAGERFISPTPQPQNTPAAAAGQREPVNNAQPDQAPHDSETAARCQLPPRIVERPV